MKNNRRDFLKFSGLAAVSLAGINVTGCKNQSNSEIAKESMGPFKLTHKQKYNMVGYAAPKLEKVRVGVIGIGARGMQPLRSLQLIEGVEVKAICDIIPDRVDKGLECFANADYKPDTYSANKDDWKKVCERNDIDLIWITTPWNLHAPMAVYAMEHGKHAMIEVPAAQTVDECWQLVETSENTKQHCMMLSNTCYDFFELLTLNMARQGFFGDIVHGDGAYIHAFTSQSDDYSKTAMNKSRTWRQFENTHRNGNLYPTHGLGPICQIMDINYGDRMKFMVSVSGNDFQMKNHFNKLAEHDEFWEPFAKNARTSHRGNMNTSTIRTSKGRTIMIQHDITSPNVYSRIHKISGTKAAALKYPLPPKISVGHEWLTSEEYELIEKKYTPKIVEKVGEMAQKVGGHGGSDFMLAWRLIDCLRNGLPLDMTVYDAAAWSVIGPLSEWSVANRSSAVDIPDFTAGAWKTNKPQMDISLIEGGNTKMI